MTTDAQTPAPTSLHPLEGRTALVTGASRGIGAAIARRLDAAGARVALTARTTAALEPVAADLTHDPVLLAGDLADAATPARIAEDAAAQLGRIDILVNNAGASEAIGPTHLLDATTIDALFALNVRAALLLTGLVAPSMIAAGRGTVINISSTAAARGVGYTALYAATKGALDAATRALAAEYGPTGIRVNTVRPGVTDTDMTADFMADPGARQYYSSLTPLRRTGHPTDVAELVTFLAGDAASHITAQTIVIDGGWADTGTIFPPTT